MSAATEEPPDTAAGPGPGARPVGTLAEEAARLVEALQQSAAGWSGASAHDSGSREEAHSHSDHLDASECRVCPMCQAIRAFQRVRPEVLQHLTDAAVSLAAAVEELAAGRGRGAPAEPPRRPQPQPQHIDVTD